METANHLQPHLRRPPQLDLISSAYILFQNLTIRQTHYINVLEKMFSPINYVKIMWLLKKKSSFSSTLRLCLAHGSRGQLLGDVPRLVISRGLMGCEPRVAPSHSHRGCLTCACALLWVCVFRAPFSLRRPLS